MAVAGASETAVCINFNWYTLVKRRKVKLKITLLALRFTDVLQRVERVSPTKSMTS